MLKRHAVSRGVGRGYRIGITRAARSAVRLTLVCRPGSLERLHTFRKSGCRACRAGRPTRARGEPGSLPGVHHRRESAARARAGRRVGVPPGMRVVRVQSDMYGWHPAHSHDGIHVQPYRSGISLSWNGTEGATAEERAGRARWRTRCVPAGTRAVESGVMTLPPKIPFSSPAGLSGAAREHRVHEPVSRLRPGARTQCWRASR